MTESDTTQDRLDGSIGVPPRRLVIVGGVAGGMSCAARARRLDESVEIVVLERGEHVSFANCGLPYYVGGEIAEQDSLLLRTPESLAESANLDVRVRHDVIALDPDRRVLTVATPAGVEELGYDALVLSPGARAVRPPLPGLDSQRVHTLRTVEDAVALRDRVLGGAGRAVVLGAGFIGVETAEAFAGSGLDVTLVELAPQVLPLLEPELAWMVRDELVAAGVEVRTGVAAARIDSGPTHDTVVLADGTTVDADVVLLSIGVRPDTAPFERAGIACDGGAIVVDEHGRTSAPGVWAVGDAVVSTDAVTGVRRPVALAGPANRAGRLVADDILRPGSGRPVPRTLGTAIVRVGAQTAAVTGANRAALARAGIAVDTIHLHPNQHAGYFPGAAPVHLVVHVRAADGLLVGAQAVGTDGVDKRIDVLATAIANRMTAADLVDLDLAYAPPYGQAKDPVNLAGMIGENLADGSLRLWYADDVDEVVRQALIVDVRGPAEFAAEHLPGAWNIPHTEIRGQIDAIAERAAGRPVRLVCASGLRSYLAHRILTQHGLDSASLSGGTMTLAAALGPRAGQLLRPEPDPLFAGGHPRQHARTRTVQAPVLTTTQGTANPHRSRNHAHS